MQENFGPPGPDRHVPGHADERARREPVRVLLHEPNWASSTRRRRGAPPSARPGMLSATPSPNGEYLLVSRIKRPFSRLLPYGGFPQDVEIWNRRGRARADDRRRADARSVPINGVMTGPRGRIAGCRTSRRRFCGSRRSTRATCGTPCRIATGSSRLPRRSLASLPKSPKPSIASAASSWTEKGLILLTENDRASRTTRTWVLNATLGRAAQAVGPPAAGQLRQSRQPADAAGHAAPSCRPATRSISPAPGASPEGDRPFLDRLDLRTLATERVFRSDDDQLRNRRRAAGRWRRPRADASRDQDGAAELRRPRPRGANAEQAVTEFADPHPEHHAGDERPAVRDLQAPGRRRPERHDLSAGRLPEGPARADARSGPIRRSSPIRTRPARSSVRRTATRP